MASSTASSLERTSISAKLTITSLDSANGPSVSVMFPPDATTCVPRVQAAGRQQYAGPGQFLDEPPHLGVQLLVRRSAAAVDRHQEPHNETSEINPAAVSI